MTAPAPPELRRGRLGRHGVAEHALTAGRFGEAGTIRLRVVPGGFGTVTAVRGRQLTVVGTVVGGARARTGPRGAGRPGTVPAGDPARTADVPRDPA